jgi:hypothetical protein
MLSTYRLASTRSKDEMFTSPNHGAGQARQRENPK